MIPLALLAVAIPLMAVALPANASEPVPDVTAPRDEPNRAARKHAGRVLQLRSLPMWLARAISYTLRSESGGRFDAMQANGDGNGLSFGIIQWTQRGGGLGELLSLMWSRHRDLVEAALGPSARRVIAVLTSGSEDGRMASVDGQPLWSKTWQERFRRLASTPALQDDQIAAVASGPYMAAAIKAMETAGLRSERGLALAFDVSVHRGTGAVASIARSTAGTGSEGQRLARFAELARAPFRRRSLDGVKNPGAWRRGADGSFYRYAGRFNLWAIRSDRNHAILASTTLSDAPLSAAQARA